MSSRGFPRFVRALAVAFALLATPIAAQAVVYFPPSNGTVAEQIRWLSHVQKHIPWLFEDSASYDIDVFELLKKEKKLIPELQEMKPFQEEAERKVPLRKVTIDVTDSQTVTVRRLKSEAIRAWRSQLQAKLAALDLSSSETLEAQIVRRIKALLDQLSQQDPKGMLTGLINSIPNREDRPAVFQQSAREQVATLASLGNLTDEAIQKSFRGENFGLESGSMTKQELLALVSARLDAEEELKTLVQLRKVVASTGAKPTLAQVAAQIESLKGPELNIFDQSQKSNPEFLAQLVADLGLDQQATKKTTAYLQRTFQLAIKSAYTTYSRKKAVVTNTVTLVEMPPYLALFRGFIGGDCSSSYSFGYPYNPLERVFFIYERGQLKGYLGGTVVKLGRTSTFYVRDVTGTRLSTQVADLALNGLSSVIEDFGADQVAIASEDLTSMNNHYSHLIKLLSDYRKGVRGSTVKYAANDSPIRKKISGHVSSDTYDSQESNSKGYVFHPRAELLATLKARSVAVDPPAFRDGPVDPKDALQLALQFQGSNRTSAAGAVREAAGISSEQWNTFTSLLTNPNALPLEAFYASINDWLSQFNIKLDGQFLRTYFKIFATGHLAAPDAMTTDKPEYIRLTAEAITAVLRKAGHGHEAIKLVAANPAVFTANARFQQMMDEMFTDSWTQQWTLAEILYQGVKLNSLESRIPDAVGFLSNGDSDVRQAGLMFLEHVKVLDEETQGAVVKMIDDSTTKVNIQAVLTLAWQTKLSAESVAKLTQIFEWESGARKYGAAMALARNGVRSEAIRAAIAELVQIDDIESSLHSYGGPTTGWKQLKEDAPRLLQKLGGSAADSEAKCEGLLANAS